MATKYMNKKNNKVMEIIKEDEKRGTMIIQFEDGTNSSITTGTFKRWYKKVEEVYDADVEECAAEEIATLEKTEAEYVAEIMEQKKELGIECPPIDHIEIVSDHTCGDGTPLAEVGKEIAKQAKEKAQKAKKERKVKQDVSQSTQTVSEILAKTGFRTKTYTGDVRTITVKNTNDKTIGDIHIGGTKCALSIPAKFVPEGYTADRVRNCPNSHAFDIAYSDLNKLENILNAIKKEEK